jgi:DNA polymerase V
LRKRDKRCHTKDIWGCGTKTTSKLDKQAIRTGLSLRDSDLKFMQSKYGSVIGRTILELRGIDAINLKSSDEPREQICVSKSMGIIVRTLSVLNSALSSHSKEAALKLRRQKSWCRKITVFIGTNHFKYNEPQYHQSMSISLPSATQSTTVLTRYALFVLKKLFRPGFNYRKIGIVLSQIDSSKETQGDLFSHEKADEISNIDKSVDSINARFGNNTIKLASEGFNRDWRPKDDLAPPSYTTNIDELPTAH